MSGLKEIQLAFRVAVRCTTRATVSGAGRQPRPSFHESSDRRDKAFVDSCMADETKAQEQLTREWEKLAHDIRQTCVGTATSIAGIQSYIELLTCIEMGTAAKKMPQQ